MTNHFLLLLFTGILATASSQVSQIDNPLMMQFNEPYGAVAFDKIDTAHYKPAFEAAMQEARIAIDRIVQSTGEPDFSNTIEALEWSTYPLKRVEQVFFNLNSAETNAAIQQIAQDISPVLTGFYNDITLNEKLFSRIRDVHNRRSSLSLTPEQQKLLEDTYKVFVRNGANLSEADKAEYREVTSRLATLSLRFEENLLHETNAYTLVLSKEEDLAGLPGFVREAAALEAKARGMEGWVFTLKAPSFVPFMKYADNRSLREEIFRAYNTRCFKGNEYDNQEVIRQIVNLRLRMANLLGYGTYADYVLEERMARTPEKVDVFLNELLQASKPAAQSEFDELQQFAGKLGFADRIQRWDWSYYSEKLRNEKFSITDEMVKPYFRLEQIEKGIFGLAGKLYGLTFRPDETLPVYHPDVKVYQVFDVDGSFLSLLYVDYFPRDGKQGGAWMTNYLEQHRKEGKDVRPHVSLVMNFTKPTETAPSLLTYDEVRTFLHEFGHALHSILSNCTYMSLAGTNVYRDFVELPSQIMENWAEQKEWLNDVAIHFETGEKMPDSLVDNILKSRNFNSGYAFIRQLSFGLNDMAWHTQKDSLHLSIADFEESAMKPAELFPRVEGISMSTGFSHIFAGGYAAGYYGYKWAEVLDADAFSVFKERGIYDRATASAFREYVLSRGGTENPAELYKNFRGQEPSIAPLLERSGLTK